MNRIERAVDCFNEGYLCSQAILSTYGPDFGLARYDALRVSGLMGAGIARQGDTCGAVTGAIMVLGLLYGKVHPSEESKYHSGLEQVNRFIKEFTEKKDSILCRDLLGYDISIPSEYKIIEDKNLCEITCPGIVRISAEILEKVIKEPGIIQNT